MSVRITPDHHALLSALSAGASWPAALSIAATAARSEDARGAWAELARAPQPFEALAMSRRVPRFVLLFLRPADASQPTRSQRAADGAAPSIEQARSTEGGLDPRRTLAHRADVARQALRYRAPSSEFTTGVGPVLLGAGFAVACMGVLVRFVVPVLEKAGFARPQLAPAAVLFVGAGLLGCAALGWRLRGLAETLAPRRSFLESVSRAFRGRHHGGRIHEVLMLRWLAAAEDAALAPAELLTELVQAVPSDKLRRFAAAVTPEMTPRSAVRAWAAAGLLSTPVARAMVGLFHGDAVRRPIAGLAALAGRVPAQAISVERALLALAVLMLGAGALVVLSGIYGIVFRLGGTL